MNSGFADNENGTGGDNTNTKMGFGSLSLPNEASYDPNFQCLHVGDIDPETAMELLCITMDKLAVSTADMLRAQAGNVSALGKNGLSSGEDTPNELHFDTRGRDLMQETLLSKRFLSKQVPPIPLKEYLARFNRYCPQSTGVYLTASLYITRIASVERVITVNERNMHRLVLAGLRVAMKTVEDLVYSHRRVARVGGVTEKELKRLEISFCFLADFNLHVDMQMLEDQARLLQWHMQRLKN
ncbi:cyclin-domain-containing protein [Aspergillus unguis]